MLNSYCKTLEDEASPDVPLQVMGFFRRQLLNRITEFLCISLVLFPESSYGGEPGPSAHEEKES